MRRALSAMPTPAHNPWPSDPVATSTHGSRGVGCPSRSESSFRSVSKSSRGMMPTSAQAAYRIGAACPFDRTKRSLSSLRGFAGSYRISTKNNAAMISAADMHVDGCPVPASLVAITESMRRRVAMFLSADTCEDVWTDKKEPPERHHYNDLMLALRYVY